MLKDYLLEDGHAWNTCARATCCAAEPVVHFFLIAHFPMGKEKEGCTCINHKRIIQTMRIRTKESTQSEIEEKMASSANGLLAHPEACRGGPHPVLY